MKELYKQDDTHHTSQEQTFANRAFKSSSLIFS
jgi:hypothetical protein